MNVPLFRLLLVFELIQGCSRICSKLIRLDGTGHSKRLKKFNVCKSNLFHGDLFVGIQSFQFW